MICQSCKGRCAEDYANEPLDVAGLEITGCPLAFVGGDAADIDQIIKAANLADRNLWPAAGGWGDQAAACVDGVEAVWAFRGRIHELKRSGKTL